MASQLIHVRITDDQKAKIDEMKSRYGFMSEAEVIRHSIQVAFRQSVIEREKKRRNSERRGLTR